jgi:hypothetical protein
MGKEWSTVGLDSRGNHDLVAAASEALIFFVNFSRLLRRNWLQHHDDDNMCGKILSVVSTVEDTFHFLLLDEQSTQSPKCSLKIIGMRSPLVLMK